MRLLVRYYVRATEAYKFEQDPVVARKKENRMELLIHRHPQVKKLLSWPQVGELPEECRQYGVNRGIGPALMALLKAKELPPGAYKVVVNTGKGEKALRFTYQKGGKLHYDGYY